MSNIYRVFVLSRNMNDKAPMVRFMEPQFVGDCIPEELEISHEKAGELFNTGDYDFTPRAVEALFSREPNTPAETSDAL